MDKLRFPHNDLDLPDLSAPESGKQEMVRYRCVGCRALTPAVDSSFTLVSMRYGWRLHREHDPVTGVLNMNWRCPECWETFRTRRALR